MRGQDRSYLLHMGQRRRRSEMRRLPLRLALMTACLALTAQARTEYFTTFEGQRLSGSEVCFFQAESDGVFSRRYFASPDVRCLPADDVIDLPTGTWNYFALNS